MHGRIAEVGIAATLLVAALPGPACASEQPTSAPSGTMGPTYVLEPIHRGPCPELRRPDWTWTQRRSPRTPSMSRPWRVRSTGGLRRGDPAPVQPRAERSASILARVLMFQTPEGASAYVAVARDHGDEVIGKAAPTADLRAPATVVLVAHEPTCCHIKNPDVPRVARGSKVVTIQIGEGAREADVPNSFRSSTRRSEACRRSKASRRS